MCNDVKEKHLIYHMRYLSQKKKYICHMHYGDLSKYASFLTSLLCVVCYDCVVCLSQLCFLL